MKDVVLMIFSSLEFLLYFFPVFFILYYITPPKYRKITLLAGSLIFYAFGETKYLLLLIVSVAANYLLGLHLERRGKAKDSKRYRRKRIKRKILLAVGVGLNLGVLLAFKSGGAKENLPLGISFYTFQIISYLVDVYRGEIRAERSFISLATYITMFPQLVSGPIVNYSEVKGSMEYQKPSPGMREEGMELFIVGLCYKVFLADRTGFLWRGAKSIGFESLSTPYAWLAAIAFSMEIYFDFYGYSLMAIGMGKMLGFELPENFRDPYMAKGVRDFYRRWHMTLGRWFKKYVYIPLGGNRKGTFRTILNLFIVWTLTSLWHGFGVNFLIWGGILFLCIAIERLLEQAGFAGKLGVLSHLFLWIIIPVTWMCFAITDVQELYVYIGRMFGFVEGIKVRSDDWIKALRDYGPLLAGCFAACTPLVRKAFEKCKNSIFLKFALAVLFWLCVRRIAIEGDNPFLYFRF